MGETLESDGLCRMTDHPNLFNYALTLLKKKGFKLLIYPNPTEANPGNCSYYAKMGGRNFDAQDPLRLLGMVCIWEQYGDDWYESPAMEIEHLNEFLMDRAYPSTPEEMEQLSDQAFADFVADYREFFELHLFPKIEIPANVSRRAFYDIVSSYYLLADQDEEE